jgi:hypothetical protein
MKANSRRIIGRTRADQRIGTGHSGKNTLTKSLNIQIARTIQQPLEACLALNNNVQYVVLCTVRTTPAHTHRDDLAPLPTPASRPRQWHSGDEARHRTNSFQPQQLLAERIGTLPANAKWAVWWQHRSNVPTMVQQLICGGYHGITQGIATIVCDGLSALQQTTDPEHIVQPTSPTSNESVTDTRAMSQLTTMQDPMDATLRQRSPG